MTSAPWLEWKAARCSGGLSAKLAIKSPARRRTGKVCHGYVTWVHERGALLTRKRSLVRTEYRPPCVTRFLLGEGPVRSASSIPRRAICVRFGGGSRHVSGSSEAATPDEPEEPTFPGSESRVQTTQLDHHKITNTDTLIIELREPDNEPATTWMIWRAQPTITDPKRLKITINAVMAILARASTRHAAIRAKRL